MSTTDDPIRNVSDTARWVAMYRALESERPDALFHDPFARRLAGERGERILDAIPHGRRTSWPMVVRTSVFDDFVLRAVRDDGADTVLNLAAGLDARPWRLPLPPGLPWFDADLPEILAHKQGLLAGEPTRCRYDARAVDLRDAAARAALFDEVAAAGSRTLVISEGLLVYLTREDVADLARALAARPTFRWWIFDLISPALMQRLARSWRGTLERGNAPFQFAPAENTRFFVPLGWREREFRSTWEDARRLKRRMAFAWVYDLMMSLAPAERRRKIRRFAGNVMLENVSAPVDAPATPRHSLVHPNASTTASTPQREPPPS